MIPPTAAPAIPELLRLLDLRGAVVTIDAMGCHKAIAAQITAQGGDYLLALKANHPLLHADAQRLFANEATLTAMHPTRAETIEKDHGRIETRRCAVLPAEALLGGLRGLGGGQPFVFLLCGLCGLCVRLLRLSYCERGLLILKTAADNHTGFGSSGTPRRAAA